MNVDNQALVIIENDVPLVDSRRVAQELGIDHRSFFRLVTEYQEEIEQDFGFLRFQITVGNRQQGGGNPLKYALLTEDQTFAYMAYSQNTKEARECKRKLVKAFAEARQALAQHVIPDSASTFSTLISMMDAGKLDQLIRELQQIRGLVSPRTSNQLRIADRDEDEKAQWEVFLQEWFNIYGSRWVQISQVIDAMNEGKPDETSSSTRLLETLPDSLKITLQDKPDSFRIRLGKSLERRLGLVYGEVGWYIERGKRNRNKVSLWRVCKKSEDNTSDEL